MARPRSEDKRNAILSAAIETLAELGERAFSPKISCMAYKKKSVYSINGFCRKYIKIYASNLAEITLGKSFSNYYG